MAEDGSVTCDLFLNLLSKTQDFYNGLSPMISRTFTANQTSFKNAFTISDVLNVASIHNSTDNFPTAYLLHSKALFQLRTPADMHEFNLAYNKAEHVRTVTGSTIATQVVSALNGIITSKGTSKLNIQFGAYGSMQSFFGLADLISVDGEFLRCAGLRIHAHLGARDQCHHVVGIPAERGRDQCALPLP